MVTMKEAGQLALLAALPGALATLAPNFPLAGGVPDLGVTFLNNNTVSPPGELIPRADTSALPIITTPIFPTTPTALLLIIDTDVPRNNTRVQLLHLLAPNTTLSSDNKTLLIPPIASTGAPNAAPYAQPSPPVGDIPHAYTLLLFAQPANFSVPEALRQRLASRVFWDVGLLVREAGLGEPLAGNYFRVQNLSGSATASFPPPASTPTGGVQGDVEFPGRAGRMVGDWTWVFGMVVLAGMAVMAL